MMSDTLTWKDLQRAIKKEKETNILSGYTLVIHPDCWNGYTYTYYRKGLFPLIRWIADKLDMPRLYNITTKFVVVKGLKEFYND